jgi:hypothetical protein
MDEGAWMPRLSEVRVAKHAHAAGSRGCDANAMEWIATRCPLFLISLDFDSQGRRLLLQNWFQQEAFLHSQVASHIRYLC